MKKRTYKKYTDVYAELERYCDQSRAPLLPPERELAELLGASRMTLRKALEEAELAGLIRRGDKRTELLKRRGLEKCGKIVFIAAGVHNEVLLGAISRLWAALKFELGRRDADFELLLSNHNTPEAELVERCQDADVILPTVFLYRGFSPELPFLQTLAERKKVIALSDPHIDFFSEYAALDNRAAGVLAAETLLAAGCRKVAYIEGADPSNAMFRKRREGFVSVFESNAASLIFPSGMGVCEHFFEQRREDVRLAAHLKCDGIFVATDEGINFVTRPLFELGLVPEKIKLLTLHGSGEALASKPPVACISHGTRGVVDALIGHLARLAGNPAAAPLRQLVAPELYYIPTLGDEEIFKAKKVEQPNERN